MGVVGRPGNGVPSVAAGFNERERQAQPVANSLLPAEAMREPIDDATVQDAMTALTRAIDRNFTGSNVPGASRDLNLVDVGDEIARALHRIADAMHKGKESEE